MANIRNKSIKELDTWNMKELRKLKITIKNRMESLKASAKPKPLPESHPLFDFEVEECQALLSQVLRAEKNLAK